MPSSASFSIVALLVLLGCTGCINPLDPTVVSSSAAVQQELAQESTDPVLRIKAAGLPPLGTPLPPVDEGRIQVSPPQDWYVPPRSSEFIARFQLERAAPYPTILITGEDSEFKDVTAENVEEFAADLTVLVDAQVMRIKGKYSEPVRPIVIGDFAGVTYAWPQPSPRTQLERLFLTTVRGGRKYELELRAVQGTVDRHREKLYAVAASLKASDPDVATESPEDSPLGEGSLSEAIKGLNAAVDGEDAEMKAAPDGPPAGDGTQATDGDAKADD